MKRIVLLFAVFLAFHAGNGQSSKKFFSNGLKKYSQKDYQGAMSDFTNAIGKNPAYAEAYYYRGLSRRAFNREINACNTMKIIQFTPAEPATGTTSGPKTCKAVNYQAISDSIDAIIRINPRDPNVLFERGVARAALKDYQGAIDDFTTTLTISPGYPEADLRRGRAKMQLNDYIGAIADFTKAIELSPGSGMAYIERSAAKSAIQDEAGSQADLKMALALDPRYKVETYNVERTHFGAGQSLEIDDYGMAIKLNPSYADAFLARGLARIKMDLKDEGCADLAQAAALGQKDAEAEIIRTCR